LVPFVKGQIKTTIKCNHFLHGKRKGNIIQIQNMYFAAVNLCKERLIKQNKLSDLIVVFNVKLRKK
jgi:hypothetical protein